MTALPTVTAQLDAGSMNLRLERASRKNAIDSDMYVALTELFGQARDNDSVRVVTLTAEGGTFCAGNDLADFEPPEAFAPSSPAFAFMRTLATFPKPLIAGVQGAAVGIGFTMLLHADILIAAEDAFFSAPFVDLGVCPEAASTILLPQITGLSRARDIFLTGRAVRADEALRIGIANVVVPAKALAGAVQEYARAIVGKPTAALAATKSLLLRSAVEMETVGRIDLEADVFCRLLRGPATAEALASRREKRRPDFSTL